MTLIEHENARYFFYERDAVTIPEAEALLDFLNSRPRRDNETADPRGEFAFVTYDGEEGVAREEAGAGEPIWLGADWGTGVPIPGEMGFLNQRVNRMASNLDLPDGVAGADRVFTSVYVDRYLPSGGFFPHTDGDTYGPVIAGVSIGPGTARLAFWPDDETTRPPTANWLIEPNSIYFLCGPIRHHPWHHSIREVSDLRYGITWRTRA